MIVGDAGFSLPLDAPFDLSNTVTVSVQIARPDGTTFTRVVTGDGLDAFNKVVYLPIGTGDLSLEGLYKVEVTDTTNGMESSDAGEFYVGQPF